MNAINSNEQMIQKINEVLQNKKDAIVNIVNDKLTISVFSLLEKNLQNVKEINFVIRDVKFLPHQSEMAHEFEINPTDILFNAYDITEKNKLQHFSKAPNICSLSALPFNIVSKLILLKASLLLFLETSSDELP